MILLLIQLCPSLICISHDSPFKVKNRKKRVDVQQIIAPDVIGRNKNNILRKHEGERRLCLCDINSITWNRADLV